MELPSIHAVAEFTFTCSSGQFKRRKWVFVQTASQSSGFCRPYMFRIKVKMRYLGPRVTRSLSRVLVRGASLEGQQDLSGGRRVKRWVTFGDCDVHELGWAAGSS